MKTPPTERSVAPVWSTSPSRIAPTRTSRPLRATLTLSVKGAAALQQLTRESPVIVLEQLTLSAIPAGIKVNIPPISMLAAAIGPVPDTRDKKGPVITDVTNWPQGTFHIPRRVDSVPAIATTPLGVFEVSTGTPVVVRNMTEPPKVTRDGTFLKAPKSIWEFRIPKKTSAQETANRRPAKNDQPDYSRLK